MMSLTSALTRWSWSAFVAGIGIGTFACFLSVSTSVWPQPQQCPEVPKKEDFTHKPIARAGEWVTAPDRSRVCKLREDLFYGMTMEIERCEDWQTPVPRKDEQVPFLRWSPRGGSQIMIEHEWRP